LATLFVATHNDLITAVRDAEQVLIANSGEDPFEEILKLIFIKLFDEVSRPAVPDFSEFGSSLEVHDRLNRLLVKAIAKWPGVFDPSVQLRIGPDHLRLCMRPFIDVRVSDEQLAVLDAAFEYLLTKTSKGTMGQYFTPRHVIDMCIRALRPTARMRVLDPACGSGGFLLHAWRFCKDQQGRTPEHLLGLDLDAKAVRIARILSLVETHGAIQIQRANAIDGRERDLDHPLGERDGWQELDQIEVDLILTNPPFAGRITDTAILSRYYLSGDPRNRSSAKGVDRDILFIERCLRMLTESGQLAIVLPQGVLANANTQYVRDWLFEHCTILGVVGLHPFTFVPHTGIKACVLFVERRVTKEDYPIFFATSSSPGKNSAGELIYKVVNGESVIDHDLTLIADIFARFADGCDIDSATRELSVESGKWARDHISTVRRDIVKELGRLDAEFFAPKYAMLEQQLRTACESKIADYTSKTIRRFKSDLCAEITYFDISSIDPDTGFATPNVIPVSEAPSRAQYVVKSGDVLVSTVRPDRNAVTLVRDTRATAVASNGLCVLRPQGIAPEYLFAFCKTKYFKTLLSRYSTASMYPAVSDGDVMEIPLLAGDRAFEAEVQEKVNNAFAKIEEARKDLKAAISMVEEKLDTAFGNSTTPGSKPHQ